MSHPLNFNPLHTVTARFFKTDINIMLPATVTSSKLPFSLGFSDLGVALFPPSLSCYISHPFILLHFMTVIIISEE
jgi:hypothetical protein